MYKSYMNNDEMLERIKNETNNNVIIKIIKEKSMWNIKDIKKNARNILKNNIWTLIILTLFITVVIGTNPLFEDWISNLNLVYDSIRSSENTSKDEIANKILIEYFNKVVSIIVSSKTDGIIDTYNEEHNIDDGVFYSIGNMISKTIAKLKENINLINNNDQKMLITLYTVILVLTVKNIVHIFITNPILVGEKRIYLESKRYKKTRLKRILYIFKRENYLKVVRSTFRLSLYQALWYLTIIGGIIKSYSYRMTQFIIAENSKISGKDAIRISREMMNGNKLKVFKIDLSFFIWFILQYITLGLASIYVNPYYRATNTELYNILREEYIKNRKYKFELLNDEKLFEDNELESYPEETKNKKQRINYNRTYKVVSLILFFFIFSFVGWVWEVLLFLLKYGKLINRGSFYGPWLPIYGTGCTLIALLMNIKLFRKITKSPLITFLIIMILCTAIEYFVSWFTENAIGVVYWDYTRNFLNINGRVCLENCIFFGLGGTLCLYVIAPLLEEKLEKIDMKKRLIIITIVIAIFTLDVGYSIKHPHLGEGITSSVIE